MKAGIHPVYINAKVSCACGEAFDTRSTREVIKLEICSACHPYYTGQQKLLDTAGRVERFQKRFQKTSGQTVVRAPVKSTMKKLVPVASRKPKVLTTAPKAEPKKGEKPAKKPAKA